MKAILGDREVKYPEFSIREGQEEISGLVEIEVVDIGLCSRYTGQIIKNACWSIAALDAAEADCCCYQAHK